MSAPVVAPEPRSRRSAQPPLRGEGLFRSLEGLFLRIERAIDGLMPVELNPLHNTGAIANTTLIVALVTGVALLLWYSPSVHDAYGSVEAMDGGVAGLMRSLHRYSSDACMVFVLLHALRLLLARRVVGARWFAWVTGCFLLAALWFCGWLGYWLVWDQRAHEVALGSAKLVDALPIFSDPLARSFLVDSEINSLLFFVVFFFHMLIPLGMGVALWLHVARTARSKLITGKWLTLWVVVSLSLLSLVLPATSAEPARMATIPQQFTMDWWYLIPLTLTDRLSGGALWALLLVGGAVGVGAPWWLRTGLPKPAGDDESKCNSCNTCFQDCPYNAITMQPRTDGREFESFAQIDTARCVGCGICSASCDSQGVGLFSWLGVRDERRRIEAWLEERTNQGPVSLAFVCAESAGRGLEVDPATGACAQLPGYLVMLVPCLGWVHTVIVQRALKRGAERVLLVGCPPGACSYREGSQTTRKRMLGTQKPALDIKVFEPNRLRILDLDATQTKELTKAAAAYLEEAKEGPAPAQRVRSRGGAIFGGIVVCGLLCGLTWFGSDFPYRTPASEAPVLVVSFKHFGEVSQVTRELSKEELEALPIHMRKKTVVSERRRADVRLRVSVDGKEIMSKAFAPGGLWGDKNATALETLELTPGEHHVDVAIGDSHDATEWSQVTEQTLLVKKGERRVLLFDATHGFRWF